MGRGGSGSERRGVDLVTELGNELRTTGAIGLGGKPKLVIDSAHVVTCIKCWHVYECVLYLYMSLMQGILV